MAIAPFSTNLSNNKKATPMTTPTTESTSVPKVTIPNGNPTPTATTPTATTPTWVAPAVSSTPYNMKESIPMTSPLAVSAENVLANQVSGKSYASTAAGLQEGQARAEAQRRAAAAAGINQAGLSGTPLGAGAGYGVEVDLMRNRFDNAIGLEQARQQSMLQGANSVNAFEAGKMTNEQTYLDNAQSNWTGMVLNDAELMDALDAAGGNTERQDAILNDWLATHPEAAKWMQVANGGGSSFNPAQMISNARRAADPAEQFYNSVKGFLPEGVDKAQFIGAVADGTLFPQLGIEFDENGKMTVKSDEGLVVDKYKTGEVAFSSYSPRNDPDGKTYQTLLNELSPVSLSQSNPTMSDSLGDSGTETIPAFETAYSKGTPIKYGNEVWYVSSKSINNDIKQNRTFGKSWAGRTVYTLVNPKTGETETVWTEDKKYDV